LPNPLIVAISGVDTDAAPARLAALTGPFLTRKVPIIVTVAPVAPEGQVLDYNSDLARWLRQTIRLNPDGLEFGVHADRILSDDAYSQVRQASEIQAAFSHLINEYQRYQSKAVIMALTLTTSSPLRSHQDAAALRAAGIRSVIRLRGGIEDTVGLQPDDGGYWTTETGLVNIFASQLSSTKPTVANGRPMGVSLLASNIGKLSTVDNPIIVDIPFGALAGLGEGELSAYSDQVAQKALAAMSSGRVRGLLPQRLYVQSRDADTRFVVVRVDDLRIDTDIDPSHMALVRELIAAGYPVTDAIIPAPRSGLLSSDEAAKAYLQALSADTRFDFAAHGWNHTPSELLGNSIQKDFDLIRGGISEVCRSTGRFPVSYIPPNDSFDDNTLDALAATGTPVFSAEKGDLRWFAGVDRRGILHVSNTMKFEKAWSGDIPYFTKEEVLDYFGTDNDAVFCIHPNTINAPEKKALILETLADLAGQRGTRLVNFDQYYRAVSPAMPKVERIQDARADVAVRDWKKPDQFPLDNGVLKADAELAWCYFDRGAKSFNGMVPATSWVEFGKVAGYPFTTMWDVGTHILATLSAQRLGIIAQQQFETTVSRILAFLGETNFRYAGGNLPHTERALGSKSGAREGFDSADTGRLLIALKILDQHTAGAFPVFKLVSGWSFGPVLKDGEMHVVSENGKVSSAHANSYAGYAGRGYSLWGEAIKPVFDTGDPGRSMDDALVALAEIQRRGRIATEPHVTEEIELGGSPHGRLMADILYAAQMKRYRETGILTCVSECAMAGPPYFTYQGYQLTDDGGDFAVDTLKTSAPDKAAKLADSLRLVSAKGAYLWHAARPGDYSEKLVALVREQARMPGMGFSSGVSEQTGTLVQVTDVNTNGIILESIAYILGGRKPLLPTEEA
jgi:peptidoglycan/xylan/chitin deacetylase (PgdA/CDA1 family)